MRKGPIDRRLSVGQAGLSAQAERVYLADQGIPGFLRAIASKLERGELSIMRCIIVGEDPDGKILLYGRSPPVKGTDDIKLLWERITSAWGLAVRKAMEEDCSHAEIPEEACGS